MNGCVSDWYSNNHYHGNSANTVSTVWQLSKFSSAFTHPIPTAVSHGGIVTVHGFSICGMGCCCSSIQQGAVLVHKPRTAELPVMSTLCLICVLFVIQSVIPHVLSLDRNPSSPRGGKLCFQFSSLWLNGPTIVVVTEHQRRPCFPL